MLYTEKLKEQKFERYTPHSLKSIIYQKLLIFEPKDH